MSKVQSVGAKNQDMYFVSRGNSRENLLGQRDLQRRISVDWKKEAEKIREVMLEHKRKLETDPEYRKRSEERRKQFRDVLFLGYEEREKY